MPYKVIQWATGEVGAECLRLLLDEPDVEVVGAFGYSASKEGRDVAELVGRPPCGVRVTTDRDEILALDADVVMHNALLTPEGWPDLDEDVRALLRSGKNVVSTASYFRPAAHGSDYAATFEDAAREGGTTLLGTGINPGFVFDRIGAMASGMCSRIDHIEIVEAYNVRGHPSPAMLFDQMGMGKRPEDFRIDSPIGEMFRRMFGEVPAAMAANLGLELDEVTVDLELGLATRDLELPAGPVEAGTIAGTAWIFHGFVDGRERMRLKELWLVDPDMPGWPNKRGWTIEVEGRPSFRLDLAMARTWGDRAAVPYYDVAHHSTAAIAVRSIPALVAAEPGILELPVAGAFRFGELGDAGRVA